MNAKRLITRRGDIYLKTGRWPSENPRPRCPYCLKCVQIARTDSGPNADSRHHEIGHWCPRCKVFFYRGGWPKKKGLVE